MSNQQIPTARYSMLIEWSDEDAAYIVTLPEWESVGLIGHTHGATYQEAAAKGQEMLDFLLESALADGDRIPQPHIFPHDASEELDDIVSAATA